MKGGARAGPDDVRHPPNWTGGYYELSIDLGPCDDETVRRAALALWSAAGLRPGPAGTEPFPLRPEDGGGEVRGAVRLPSGRRVVAMVHVIRAEYGDWLGLCLPLGALADADRRVGGFPFGPEGGVPARAWREPLDDWLAGLGRAVCAEVPFDHAVIGFEVGGEERAPDLLTRPDRWVTTLVRVDDRLEHLPVTRWDGGVTFD